MIITSRQNPRIKYAVSLRDRRDRDREQKMLIEGYRGVLRAHANAYPLEVLFICPELYQGVNDAELVAACAASGVEIIETSAEVFIKMAYRDRPEGLLAVAPQRHLTLAAMPETSAPPLLLVAEAIEKPGNLGTMLRSADATGVSSLVLCDRCTDLFNPNVVRASVGTLFTVPVLEATSDETIAWLRRRSITILAATPHADKLYTEVDMTTATAVVVGSEQYGLSEKWLEQADITVRIPMLGQADSLNVATAATLLMYEAVRQRAVVGR